mmetsp:Transcript_83907/g.246056  ORF Transcript_83907/g.246056 Transcript_83907/m.246056 type:complete len:244 (+) Transcript_83907:2688-3419(+)
MALVGNHYCMGRAIWSLLEFTVLHVCSKQAVRYDPELGTQIQGVRPLLDDLDLMFTHIARQPVLGLFFPHPAQGGRTDHQDRPLLSILSRKGQRLHSLPQSHLVTNQTSPSSTDPKTHPLKLVRKQSVREPCAIQFARVRLPCGCVHHLQNPGWDHLYGAHLLQTPRNNLMTVKLKRPSAAVAGQLCAGQSPYRLPDVGRQVDEATSHAAIAPGILGQTRRALCSHEELPIWQQLADEGLVIL